MPAFNYKARDKRGNLETGIIETPSEESAAEILAAKGFILTGLIPKEKVFSLRRVFRDYSVISLKHLMVFSKQLSVMINAGLPIVDSLRTLAEEETNVKFAEMIADIAKNIEGGESLSSSLEKYPEVFSLIYVNLVRVGETSGKLDVVLLKIAEQLEKDHELRTKVKGAMIYPSFILVAMVAVAILMVSFVIPRLRPILEGAGVKLPLLTKGLIFSSEILVKWWWLILPFFILGIIILRIYFRSPRGGEFWAYAKLKIPVLGMIVGKIYMTRFTRTFATLISGGINILKALEITSDAVGNVHYKRDILRIAKEVKNGASLADSFKESKKFPRIVKQMVKVGENTGTLDTSIGKLADFFEGEVENTVNNLTKLLEPVLIIIMGIGVALIVSSVIMPLYDITKAIK